MFSKNWEGLHYSCSYRRENVFNAEALLEATPTTSQRVASRIIKKSDGQSLKTLGPSPMPVSTQVKWRPSKKQFFTANQISNIQNDLGISTTQVLNLAENLRSASGNKNIIEKDLREKIRDSNHNLKESFEVRKCNFATILEGKPNKNFEEHLVVCNDINSLIEKMIAHRDIKEENMQIRIGIDGGGGFFKMCLSVFDINEKKEQEDIKKRL